MILLLICQHTSGAMIQKAHIKNFYGLPEISIGEDISENYARFNKLNVVTGPNASGKTGLLKLLYANLKAVQEWKTNQLPTKPSFAEQLSEKLRTTFMPKYNGLSDLVTKKSGPAEIAIEMFSPQSNDKLAIKYELGQEAKSKISTLSTHEDANLVFDCVFIPSKEVLTIINAINLSRELVQLPDFDDTYYDLVKALRIPEAANPSSDGEGLKKVSHALEAMFEGRVVQDFENGVANFTYKVGNQRFAMHQTAEGIKKVGILTTLLQNKKIRKNTILFLDEPETALNPIAQREFVRILNEIAKLEGVQVFLATHSYYVVSQLYNLTLAEEQSITCIALDTQPDQERGVRYFDLKNGIPFIPIMQEALALQSEENRLQLGLLETNS